jgi:hypothetical protein
MTSAVKLKMKPTVQRYAGGGVASLVKKPKVPRYEEGGTTSTQYVSNIPEYAKESYADLVGRAEALTGPDVAYQQYGGDRTAQFTDLQKQAGRGIAGLGVSGYTDQAGGLASTAANRALDSSYGPSSFNTYGSGPQQVQAGAGPQQVGTYGSAPQQVGTQSFLQPGTAGAYMNPYMQNVVDTQKREAVRSDDVARTGRQAAAVGAGAYGGSRQAIMESEANRNLQTRLGDIQTTGSNAAYQQAQQQFNAEQGLGLQAQQANQQAGLNFGNQYLQSQQANQTAGLNYGNQLLQAQQANQTAGLNYGNQYLDAQRLGEASRQFGATYGLQGLQTGLQGATALGGLGNDAFKQQYTAATGQNEIGGQQQAQAQSILDKQYADYQTQMNYPYQQIGFMSDILRGTQGTSRSMYEQPAQPSNMQNLLGIGTALAGASKSGLFADGGAIGGGLAAIAPDSDFADGGIVGYAEGGGTNEYGDAPGAMEGYRAIQRFLKNRPAPIDAMLETAPGAPYRLPANQQPTSWLYKGNGAAPEAAPYSNEGRGKTPPTPQEGIDAGAVTADTSGSGIGGGIASIGARQVRAAPARTMEEMRATRDATVDLPGFKKEGLAALAETAAMEKSDAELAEQELAARHAAQGTLGADREKKLQGRLDELGARGERSKGDALMQMGLSILTADPRRGWQSAVGTGGLAGLAQFRGDEEKLRAEKAKLDDSMDTLIEARRQEDLAKGKEKAEAKRAVRTAEITSKKNANSFLQATGIKGLELNSDLWKTFETTYEHGQARAQAADIANATNDMHLGLGKMRLDGIGGVGGVGGKPMTQAQYDTAVRQELEKMRTMPEFMQKPRAALEQLAQATVQRRQQREAAPYDTTGWGQPKQ